MKCNCFAAASVLEQTFSLPRLINGHKWKILDSPSKGLPGPINGSIEICFRIVIAAPLRIRTIWHDLVHTVNGSLTASLSRCWGRGHWGRTGGRPWRSYRLRRVMRQPRVNEDILGGQSLFRILPQETANETPCPRRQVVRKTEGTPANLGEQACMLLTMEGVPVREQQKSVLFLNFLSLVRSWLDHKVKVQTRDKPSNKDSLKMTNRLCWWQSSACIRNWSQSFKYCK